MSQAKLDTDVIDKKEIVQIPILSGDTHQKLYYKCTRINIYQLYYKSYNCNICPSYVTIVENGKYIYSINDLYMVLSTCFVIFNISVLPWNPFIDFIPALVRRNVVEHLSMTDVHRELPADISLNVHKYKYLNWYTIIISISIFQYLNIDD